MPAPGDAGHRPGAHGPGHSGRLFPRPGAEPGDHHPGAHGWDGCQHRHHRPGICHAITLLYSQELLKEKMTRLGVGKISPPIEPRIRIWFNPDLESKNFIVPGLIAIIMCHPGRHSHLRNHLPGMGAGDHGTAHLHPHQQRGADSGQTDPLLPHRDDRPGALRRHGKISSSVSRCGGADFSSSP